MSDIAAVAGWDALELGEITDRRTERNLGGNDNVLTISASEGLISQAEYFNRIVASNDLRPYYLLNRGDFAYNKSYSAGYPVGVIRRLDRYEAGVVSPLYICFRPRSSAPLHPDFLAHFLGAGMIDDGIASIAKEGARNHGLLNVGTSDFFGIEMLLPSLEEQRRIAEVLDTIDDTTRATERIIDKLEESRAGLVQEMVSTSMDWSQRPIGDLLSQVVDNRGRTPPYTKSGVPVISAENVGRGVVKSTTKWVTEDMYHGWTRGVPRPGDVLLTTEAPVGEVALLPSGQPYLLTRRVVALGPDRSRLTPEYLYWFLRHFKWAGRWDALSHGTTVPRLLKPDLLAIPIGLASLAEQQIVVAPIAAITEQLIAERASLGKLRLSRNGLAADLLSGRVRTLPA